MRTILPVLMLLVALGAAAGQTYTSVQDAVSKLPELSMLNSQVSTLSLATLLASPTWVGTVFAPTNAALKPLQDALGGDISAALGNQQQVNDFFATSVIPGKALTLADLTNGAKLTTLNGGTVTITVKSVPGGRAYYANKARIATCCIPVGRGVIHEVAALVAPADYQSMLDMVAPTDAGANTPTAVWVSATPPTPSPSPSPRPSPSPVASSPAVGSPSPAPAGSPSPANSPAPGGSTDAPAPASPTPTGADAASPSPAASPVLVADPPIDTAVTPDPAAPAMDSSALIGSGTDTGASDAAQTEAAQMSGASSARVMTALVIAPLLLAALL